MTLHEFLAHFPGAKATGQSSWMARCPIHDDSRPSLSIKVRRDGWRLLNCFGGCATEAIVDAARLTMSDLFPATTGNRLERRPSKGISLADLAREKLLPVEFLQSCGLHDIPRGGVAIPYRDFTGKTVAIKKRTELRAKDGSFWPKGQALLAYGLDRLAIARERGALLLVEGETDALTAWHHGRACLGIPGASATSTLQAEHLDGLTKIYIVQEADNGGQAFVKGLARRLQEVCWRGEAFVIQLNDAKDISALHIKLGGDPGKFAAAIGAAVRAAKPLPAPAAPESDAPADGALDSGSKLRSRSRAGEMSEPTVAPPPPWPTLDSAALHGLAGAFVRLVEPHSEADPAALIVSFITAFGSVIGRDAHARAEADRHHGNLFACLVGETSKGRKGTSWGHVLRLLEHVDPKWAADCIAHGLSSGEGLIWSIRDPIIKKAGIDDEGVSDKRILVVETELAQTLRVLAREGNTLSPILRAAWDSGSLRSMTKNSPARATGAHVSVLGHVTREEVRATLRDVEIANGFANRFLWVAVKRSKVLPEGGSLQDEDLHHLVVRVREAVDFWKSGPREIHRDEGARGLWCEVYEDLSEGRPGVLGAVTGRAEAQVLRLSLLYALLDQSPEIRREHLGAALALWRYAEQSALWIFGTEEEAAEGERHALIQMIRRRGDRISARDLQNCGPPDLRVPGAAVLALEDLVSAGLGSWEPQGGRKGPVFVLAGGPATVRQLRQLRQLRQCDSATEPTPSCDTTSLFPEIHEEVSQCRSVAREEEDNPITPLSPPPGEPWEEALL